MKLNKSDYLNILRFYNINISSDAKINEIRNKAEDIISKKLCRCIKKIQKPKDLNESRAIAICQNSVLGKKNIKINRFTCKKKPKLLGKKGKKTKLIKIH